MANYGEVERILHLHKAGPKQGHQNELIKRYIVLSKPQVPHL